VSYCRAVEVSGRADQARPENSSIGRRDADRGRV